MRSLSRLRSLQAFEAAARHRSFIRAAEELGITPTAVGQLVRSLEDWSGRPLFRRSRSGKERLSLTEEATAALEDISAGLDALENGMARLKSPGTRSSVLVTTSHALAANWLIYRLQRFSDLHPDIDIRLDVSDRTLDIARGEADIGVRCGPGGWRGLKAAKLMDEVIVAVTSPNLLTEGNPDAGWFARQQLIEDASPHPGGDFPSWRDWCGRFGMKQQSPASIMKINSASAAIQAAVTGHGIALVRRALVANLLATRQLQQVWPGQEWPINWSYYVVTAAGADRRREVRAFYDWLVDDTLAGLATP